MHGPGAAVRTVPRAGCVRVVAAGSPPAEQASRGQAWKGTDRQVRGAIMAVLRAAEEPVARPLLLVDTAGSEQLAAASPAPPDVVVDRLTALWRLEAPAEQRERALAGLLGDGLAAEQPTGISLPG